MTSEHRRLSPEDAAAWQRISRDVSITLTGCFSAVFGVIFVHDATLLTIILGFSATVFGVPAALRIDEKIRAKPEERGERWSHLP